MKTTLRTSEEDDFEGDVIKGWEECLSRMSEGQRVRFTCPPNMAYGPLGWRTTLETSEEDVNYTRNE